jgi:hypothetical protein
MCTYINSTFFLTQDLRLGVHTKQRSSTYTQKQRNSNEIRKFSESHRLAIHLSIPVYYDHSAHTLEHLQHKEI